MSETKPAAQVDTQAATATGTTDETGQAQQSQEAGQQPWLNKAEAVDYFKRTRELERQLAELRESKTEAAKPPEKPGDPSAQIAALQARLDFRDAIAEAGLSLTRKQQDLLETAYRSQRPSNLGQWVRDQAEVFGSAEPKAATTPAPAEVPVPEQAKPVSNQGAPLANPGALPDDPRLIPPHIWKNLKREDRMARVNGWMAKNGMSGQAFKK